MMGYIIGGIIGLSLLIIIIKVITKPRDNDIFGDTRSILQRIGDCCRKRI